MDSIEPIEIATSDKIPKNLMQVNISNSFAYAIGGEFYMATIDKSGRVATKVLSPGFPGKEGDTYESDDQANFIWMRNGRGVYIYDINANINRHVVASADGNNDIGQIIVADQQKKIMFIEVMEPPKDGPLYTDKLTTYYVQYDFLKDEIVFATPKVFTAGIVRLKPSELLYGPIDPKTDQFKWCITNPMLEMKVMNKFTKKISEVNFGGRLVEAKTFDAGKRVWFGSMTDPSDIHNEIQCMVHWSEDYEDFSITLLAPMQPGGRAFSDSYMVSQDGNWVKTTDPYVEEFPPQVMFMNLGPYPGGVSMPVKGGYTDQLMHGVWIMHDTWGPCYIENHPSDPKKLMLYRMSDALPLIPGIMQRALLKK